MLSDYEKQFNTSTVEFFKRYQAGQTDDSTESMEWASLAQMAKSIRERLAMLSCQVKDIGQRRLKSPCFYPAIYSSTLPFRTGLSFLVDTQICISRRNGKPQPGLPNISERLKDSWVIQKANDERQ